MLREESYSAVYIRSIIMLNSEGSLGPSNLTSASEVHKTRAPKKVLVNNI